MNSENQFDVIIIGAGPSGIFCAYELIRQKPDMKILMLEKGVPLKNGRVQNVPPKPVSAVSHVPLPPDLPEPVHFLTENFLCHQT